MSIESRFEFEGLRAAGAVVAETLRVVAKHLRPGVTTLELDAVAAGVFQRRGANSGPALDFGYPAAICISVNEEAVHGLPGSRVIAPGDLVTLDATAELDGFYADAARTHVVPPVSALARRLVRCAESAFVRGVEQAVVGNPIWRIGEAVETEVRRRGLRVLRDLCGHGVGRAVHEEPSIPNYRDLSARQVLHENLVITIEPIVSATAIRSRPARDGWTLLSADRSLTAHHEHTLVIRRGRPHIVTAA